MRRSLFIQIFNILLEFSFVMSFTDESFNQLYVSGDPILSEYPFG